MSFTIWTRLTESGADGTIPGWGFRDSMSEPPNLPRRPRPNSGGADAMGPSDVEEVVDLGLDAGGEGAIPPPRQSPATAMPAMETAPSAASAAVRDRIVVLGRRQSGKTVYLARLYEALWRGCRMIDGRVVAPGEDLSGKSVTELLCRATTGPAHAHFMAVAEDLRAGRWPQGTIGTTYAELLVTHAGREHTVTAIDYPGEVFRKAFMAESADPDAVELRATVDRAAAAIILIDPEIVARGGPEAQEDTFGLTQATARIRASVDGALVPIAIVFTKCDESRVLLREAGGVRAFAEKHFSQLFRGAQRTSVFPCAAVRSTRNTLGKSVPRADKPPENVVEPLRYCLDQMERGADVRVAKEAKQRRREARRQAAEAEAIERKKSAGAWLFFTVAIAMLLAATAIGTFWFMTRNR